MKRNGRRQFDNRDWTRLKRQYKFRCVRCSQKETPDNPLTIDHVTPVTLGGARSILNIQPLCRACNLKKANTWADYRWRKFKD